MLNNDPALFREIPLIKKIISDETWLEGERRGCSVSPHDPIVRARVCEIILRIGQQLRDSVQREVTADGSDDAPDGHRQAA